MPKSKNKDLTAYFFIAPQMLGYLLFVLGPLIAVVVYSFQDRNLLTNTNSFIGFKNYHQMFFSDPIFWKTIGNTLVFSFGQVPINIGLSLFIAILLAKPFTGVGVYRTIIFAPVVTSAVAWAIVWKFLLQGGDKGAVNSILGIFGIEGPNWLYEKGWAMVSVIFNRVIKNLGMNVIIFLAAVMNLPEHYYEAAKIDGAGKLIIFRKITVPLLMPTLMMVTILTVIGSLKVFDTILLLTGGGPNNSTMVLVYYIYYQAFQFFQYGYASAVAIILFLIVFIMTLIQWSTRRRISFYEN